MSWVLFSGLILFCLCLLVRFNRRLWAWLLHLQSGFLRYTLMIVRPVCLLFFSYLLIFSHHSVHSVAAQTPTPTNSPYWITPTQPETFLYHCPIGLPEGWGQYEPHPVWLLHCGHCVPSEGGYDWGSNPFDATPDPSIPTPTPTPTEVVLGQPNLDTRIVFHTGLGTTYPEPGITEYWAGNYNYNQWQVTTLGSYYNDLDGDDKDYKITVNLKQTLNFIGGSSAYSGYNLTWKYQLNNNRCSDGLIVSWDNIEVANISMGNSYEIPYAIHNLHTGGGYEGGYWWLFECKGSNNAAYDDIRIYDKNSQFIVGSAAKAYELTYWLGEYDPLADVPLPSYCDEVIPADGGGNEPGFQLPNITIGQASCFSVGGFSIPTWAVELLFGTGSSLPNTPGIEFCFVPLEFGYLELFGITVDLDFIAIGMAAVLIFRIITRS